MSVEAIDPDRAQTLTGLFRERVTATPDRPAYRQFDSTANAWKGYTWAEVAHEVARWQAALTKEGLAPGDRVAVMLKNCVEWVIFDQAALGLGLVTVPLYLDDRPDNAAWIVDNADARLLLVEGRFQHRKVAEIVAASKSLERVVSLLPPEKLADWSPKFALAADWLKAAVGDEVREHHITPEMLASIVYTSGTTGRPKGVMLTHENMLWNAWYSSRCVELDADEVFLSFLPLSHTLERTGGYYLSMLAGCEVVYARSVNLLAQDLASIRPTVLISVPRIYERVYARIQDALSKKGAAAQFLFRLAVDTGWQRFEHAQGRAAWHPRLLMWPILQKLVAVGVMRKLGGRLKYAISGGAALPPEIARTFIGLGVPLLQGYGLTEASPAVTANRPESNIPESIGKPLPGVEIRIGEHDELLTRSRCVMRGYWGNPDATAAAIDGTGWLHSGDQVRVDNRGHYYITGRIKDIIVLSNGEKVPPGDMESAITLDPLFDHAMVIGEGKPCLAALVALNEDNWRAFCDSQRLDASRADILQDGHVHKLLLARLSARLKGFPGYAQIRRAFFTLEPWTAENGLLTPTMKMKRASIGARYAPQIESLFSHLTG
ncbi:MAG: AMP-dependent synthetase/ligase [Pseudomonadota bacterium]